MDVVISSARTSNRNGSEVNRSNSVVGLPPNSERDHAAAEFLLELLTVDEIAAALRVSPSWVYERVRKRGRDKMPHLKIGKYLRFRLNEVRTWIDQGVAQCTLNPRQIALTLRLRRSTGWMSQGG
jgi:excisionase family DNA binding protein